jgi:hypothetical protein
VAVVVVLVQPEVMAQLATVAMEDQVVLQVLLALPLLAVAVVVVVQQHPELAAQVVVEMEAMCLQLEIPVLLTPEAVAAV